jgi:hypothetical protein
LIELAQMYSGALGAAMQAEKKLAELAQARPNVKPFRGERPESFIHRQNVEHYRALLDSDKLDAARRDAVEKLLFEEEAKYAESEAMREAEKSAASQRKS